MLKIETRRRPPDAVSIISQLILAARDRAAIVFYTEDSNLYATVAHGFKSGGFNINPGTTAMDQRQFRDEDIMHYETGLKSEQLGGKYWVDFRVGTRLDNYELTAWVNNALDENVANFEALLTLFPNDPSYQTFRQPPRSYGVTLQMDF
ncbi:MAG: hypothetical protein KDI17_10160 [Halioglobus sp.]|nr:hypothetical protein [Halioglobus sp.]